VDRLEQDVEERQPAVLVVRLAEHRLRDAVVETAAVDELGVAASLFDHFLVAHATFAFQRRLYTRRFRVEARIPRRRHRHRLPCEDPRRNILFLRQAERRADILATILARMSARMSVSASRNASFINHNDTSVYIQTEQDALEFN